MFIRDITKLNLYYPPESIESGAAKPETAVDIDSLFSDDSPEDSDEEPLDVDVFGEPNKKETPKKKASKEESEDDEDEDEDEEESDESEEEESDPEINLDEEDLNLSHVPKRAELKKVYPDIFKKFPALDHIIQREHAFAEVFPTIGDAKEAKEIVQNFKELESEVMSGSIEGFLKSVKGTSEQAFNKMTSGLLESLNKVDPQATLYLTTQVSKAVISQLNNLAKAKLSRNKDDKSAQQLEIATELIHEAIFNSREITPFNGSRQETKLTPEQEKFEREKKEFEDNKYKAAFTEVSESMDKLLRSSITNKIDEKNLLPSYVKGKLVDDVLNELQRQVGQDSRFRNVLTKHWENAKKNGYKSSDIENIKTAIKRYVAPVLPQIMKRLRAEAMKGLSTRKKAEDIEEDDEPRTERANGQPRKKSTYSKRESNRREPNPGESVADFLARD